MYQAYDILALFVSRFSVGGWNQIMIEIELVHSLLCVRSLPWSMIPTVPCLTFFSHYFCASKACALVFFDVAYHKFCKSVFCAGYIGNQVKVQKKKLKLYFNH